MGPGCKSLGLSKTQHSVGMDFDADTVWILTHLDKGLVSFQLFQLVKGIVRLDGAKDRELFTSDVVLVRFGDRLAACLIKVFELGCISRQHLFVMMQRLDGIDTLGLKVGEVLIDGDGCFLVPSFIDGHILVSYVAINIFILSRKLSLLAL